MKRDTLGFDFKDRQWLIDNIKLTTRNDIIDMLRQVKLKDLDINKQPKEQDYEIRGEGWSQDDTGLYDLLDKYSVFTVIVLGEDTFDVTCQQTLEQLTDYLGKRNLTRDDISWQRNNENYCIDNGKEKIVILTTDI